MSKITRHTTRLLASRYALPVIVFVVLLQGLWYAFTFQLAMYDEPAHFGTISMFADGVSPFDSSQNPKYDYLGETTRNPSYLFMYMMSFLLRSISIFTENTTYQIIALRIVCITLFILSVVYYRKSFDLAGIPKAISNSVLLFFVITPGVAVVPGVISYDNPGLLITAFLLFLVIKTVKSKKPRTSDLLLMLGLSMVSVLVKFTLVAIVVPLIIFLIVHLYLKFGKSLFRILLKEWKFIGRLQKVVLVAFLVIATALFIERIGMNVIKYHAIDPACTSIKTEERCDRNFIAKRNITNERNAEATGFQPTHIYNYFLKNWTPYMIKQQASPTKVLPIMGFVYFTIAFGGTLLIVLYLRELLKKKEYRPLVVLLVAYPICILLYTYMLYVKQGVPVATNGRYLFPVLPIYGVFLGLALLKLFKNRAKECSVALLFVLIALMTQGGGIITYMMDNFEFIYWENDLVMSANSHVEGIVRPLVKE